MLKDIKRNGSDAAVMPIVTLATYSEAKFHVINGNLSTSLGELLKEDKYKVIVLICDRRTENVIDVQTSASTGKLTSNHR